MPRSPTQRTQRGSPRARDFDSGDALFALDLEMRIVSWNEASERLTGTPADRAVGRYCWEVLGGVEPQGAPACGPNCRYAQLVRARKPVASHRATIATDRGPRIVVFSTVGDTTGRRSFFLHLMREIEEAEQPLRDPGWGALTPRQTYVLTLLADGLRVNEIAERLGVSVVTVRNHVQAILTRLGCHSQLEAVAAARRLGLLKR